MPLSGGYYYPVLSNGSTATPQAITGYLSGTVGPSGAQGPVGPSGAQGPPGPSGTVGPLGSGSVTNPALTIGTGSGFFQETSNTLAISVSGANVMSFLPGTASYTAQVRIGGPGFSDGGSPLIVLGDDPGNCSLLSYPQGLQVRDRSGSSLQDIITKSFYATGIYSGATDSFTSYAGGIVIGASRQFRWNNRGRIADLGNGAIQFTDFNGSGFDRLMFGTATANSCSITFSGSTMKVRNGTNLADAPIIASLFSGTQANIATASIGILTASQFSLPSANLTVNTITASLGMVAGSSIVAPNFQDSAGNGCLGAIGGVNYPLRITNNGVMSMYANRFLIIGSNQVGVGNGIMEQTVRSQNVSLAGTAGVWNVDLANSNIQLLGLTAKVTTAAAGSGLTGINIGDSGSAPVNGTATTSKFGSNIGIALNSFTHPGLFSVNCPITYNGTFNLTITPIGATTFTAGVVRVVAYFTTFALT